MTPAERPYHHGHLRDALLDEGVALARAGGPDAVLLRDAARRVGVSHTAGYRHFADRDDYLAAVGARCMAALATAMEESLQRVPGDLDEVAAARARLSATGWAYVSFAVSEQGLFRTAFAVKKAQTSPGPGDARGSGGLDPYELLVRALDDLARVGVLPPGRRAHSEIVAWSAVHGLSELLIDGPLRGASDAEIEALWARVNDSVLRGL